MWRKRNTPALLVGTQTGNAATVGNSMELPRKGQNRSTPCSSKRTAGYLPEEYKNTNSKGYLHPHVYSSIIRIAKVGEQPKCPSG